ncbi:hypothetical protein SDC9_152719 [bioreactor metagenome]|uniref:Uncharacterized protein n=1 Tax=bioreactor metagenome TaxID=1076179 RepID=A0A645EW83_9ZZZZ
MRPPGFSGGRVFLMAAICSVILRSGFCDDRVHEEEGSQG